jgi:hypothetical protein
MKNIVLQIETAEGEVGRDLGGVDGPGAIDVQ